MIKWRVNKVKNIWLEKAPYPNVHGLVKKQFTDWVFWEVETKKTIQLDIDRALSAIPDPSNIDGICQFWMDYGPIAAGYVPKLCRGCVKKANDILKPLSLEIKGAPLEAVQKAVGLLYSLAITHEFSLAKDKDEARINRSTFFLASVYENMSEKWRQHAKPMKHMYLSFDSNVSNKRSCTSTPQPWWRNYSVRVPICEDKLLDWGEFEFMSFKDVGKVSFTNPPNADDGYLTITVDYLFPLLLNHYREEKHQPKACVCGCGKLAKPESEYAHPSHRKRVWWNNSRKVLKLWKEGKSIEEINEETGLDIEKIKKQTNKIPRP